jgi:hypothetical protein
VIQDASTFDLNPGIFKAIDRNKLTTGFTLETDADRLEIGVYLRKIGVAAGLELRGHLIHVFPDDGFSDASPLISLAAIDRLDLLRRLYNEVIIPEAVRREVVMTAPGAAGAADAAGANWINIRSVEDRTLVEALRVTLDLGEAEAIALALEVNAELLLVDERRARAVA